MINYKEIYLSDDKYFELFIGKRLLKKDLIHITGEIPIYSANAKKPIAFHNKSNINDFNNNFVLWGIDGDFEFNSIGKNIPFATTDHCGTIRILHDDILPEYLMLQLERVKHKFGFDRGLRSSLKNMNNVCVEIPFDHQGQIDVKKQKEIVEMYECINEFKTKINHYIKLLHGLEIDINIYLDNAQQFNISMFFNIKNPSCKLFKKDIQSKGCIPVFSSRVENEGVIGYSNIELFNATLEKPLITFGDHTKVFNIRTQPFAVLDNVKVLELKNEYKNKIDLEYVIFSWQSKIEEIGYSRYWRYAKTIEISIPVTSERDFDISTQKEIAEKYRSIEHVKKNIVVELDKIINKEIEII